MRRLLLVLPLLVSLTAAAIELPRPNEKWLTLKVDEFEIISNASPESTVAIAQNLVRMRAAVGQLTHLNVRSRVPTSVIVFANERSFAPYRELVFPRNTGNISGVFLGGENSNFILLQAGSENGLDRIIYHELTHYFVKNTIAGLPVWLNEGMAEYYSTFRTDGDEVHIGRPVAEHVMWLRNEQLIPLRDLFAVDRDSSIYNEGSRQGVFYAESWALLHYLMLGNEERRAQFGKLMTLLDARKSMQEAFETAFGMSYARMEGELRAYVRRRAFNYTKYSLRDLIITPVPQPEPMTYAAYVFALGHLLANSRPSNAEAAELFLAEALKANPANAGAHADMGRLHDLAGRDAEAEKAYQRAVQLGSTDPQIYLRYGSSIINRIAESEDNISADDVLKARRQFERSAQLDPSLARAWAGIGATYAAGTEDPAPGIAALEKSLSLAPGDQEAAFYLVQLYARIGRRAEATKLIETVIAPSGDRELLDRSREALLMADMRDVQTLADAGNLKEAAAIARAIIEKTTNPALAEHLRKMIVSMETYDAAETATTTFNDAVAKANGGQYAEALKIVDGLLPNITDPEMLERAKEFRDEIAERAKRRKQ
ncbi:MAG TPA: hypothetical protein VKB93_29795 [Thermoanaerobaculia bacterium]|nr:hypothetical protein [Thermoanaerobaculia bacterium]